MKKGILITIVWLICLILLCWVWMPRHTTWAGPTPTPIVIDPNTTAVKIDDNTVEITTTRTTVTVVEHNKAELETEKFHIHATTIAELEKQIDKLNERSTEIDNILSVFD